uniref:Uncharacterized protein n=1 Tax=Timema tahoe TaxID=61484 RepID=A0A7R9NW16_9NEOP|nr:unnamed protein product [Timema tahoe]
MVAHTDNTFRSPLWVAFLNLPVEFRQPYCSRVVLDTYSPELRDDTVILCEGGKKVIILRNSYSNNSKSNKEEMRGEEKSNIEVPSTRSLRGGAKNSFRSGRPPRNNRSTNLERSEK